MTYAKPAARVPEYAREAAGFLPAAVTASQARSVRMLLLLFVLAWNLAEGVAAQPLATTIAEFHQALDALDSAPGDRSEREIRTVARKAGDILTQHGIKWHLATESEDAIIIAPVRGASKLNDLAYSLRRNVGGLELRFDPRALKEENAGALYYDDTHQLVMSAQEIATGTISDYLAHEILHAQNFHALSRGVDNLFMGWISSRESAPPFHEAYRHQFSIDELQAYAQQARSNLRELNRGDGHRDAAGTIEMLESGLQLARAASGTSKRAAAVIASIADSKAARRRFSEMRTIDDEPVRVTGFESANGSVYFYRWRLPERISSPPPVMRAVAEFGDYSLDLILPKVFLSASAEQMLARFVQRTEQLADRSERIAAKFIELEALVARGEFSRALKRSHELRTLIRRN